MLSLGAEEELGAADSSLNVCVCSLLLRKVGSVKGADCRTPGLAVCFGLADATY